MSAKSALPIVPASAYGVVLGLAGLGGAWRTAHHLWNLPEVIGEVLMAVATAVWTIVTVLYLLKWLFVPEEARTELRHPIQCCFVGLVGVSTLLIAGAALPYSRLASMSLFVVGAVWTLVFAVWQTGSLWQGGREETATTPVLYLPLVGGSFVAATILSALGYADWGQFAFGGGIFTWLAIESVLLRRLYIAPELPLALRPALGIQLAPPTVGTIAYLSVTSGPPDFWAHALIGYGIVQGLVLLRLLPWIMEQPFSLSYWGFSFGLSAIAGAPLRFVARGDVGPIAEMAPYLFAIGNIAIAVLALGTLRLAVTGRLLPKPLVAVQP